MKKVLVLVMAFGLSLSALGCSNQNAGTNGQSKQVTSESQLPAALVDQIKKEGVKEAVDKYYAALPHTNNRIDPKDVYAKIQSNPNSIFILDIRDLKGDRTKVPGAIHCYWYEVGKHLSQLPKDKTIIVHCWTGQAGMQVATTLRLLGYDAWAMNGGWSNGWLPAGFPTEKYDGTNDVWDDLNSPANSAQK